MANNQPNEFLKKKINQLIDNELPTADKQKLMDKAAVDPSLGNFIKNEIEFRQLIKENIKRAEVSNSLKQQIHSIIHSTR